MRNPDAGTDTQGIGNSPIVNHVPGSQAFEIIRTVLESFRGVPDVGGQHTESTGNTGNQNGVANQGQNQKPGGNSTLGNYGQGSKGNYATGGSTNRGTVTQREKTKQFLNRKIPVVIKFICKFVLGIARTSISLGK